MNFLLLPLLSVVEKKQADDSGLLNCAETQTFDVFHCELLRRHSTAEVNSHLSDFMSTKAELYCRDNHF